VLKARFTLFVRIGGSSSLVDFPNPEAGVDVQVSIQFRRLKNAFKTVASLFKFKDARTKARES
jgi:hypothetical protein